MYAEFLEMVLAWIEALNRVEKDHPGDIRGMTPYLSRIPVVLDEMLCGFLVDEVGGVWSYAEATPADRMWWERRPGQKAEVES